MSIGKTIKEMRIKKGLTQKELGDKMGVSQAMIGQYENGSRHPKTETVQKFSEALGVPLKSFYDFNNLVIASKDEKSIEVFLTDEIDRLLYYEINDLNVIGKQKVLDYSKDIADNPKYKKDPTE